VKRSALHRCQARITFDKRKERHRSEENQLEVCCAVCLRSTFLCILSGKTPGARLTADQSTTSERELERRIATADFVDKH